MSIFATSEEGEKIDITLRVILWYRRANAKTTATFRMQPVPCASFDCLTIYPPCNEGIIALKFKKIYNKDSMLPKRLKPTLQCRESCGSGK
jgi:hypothetical protein